MESNENFAPKDWFNSVFGFKETVESVIKNFEVSERKDYVELTSKVNQRKFNAGNFQIKSSDRSSYQLSESPGGGKLHIIHGYGKESKHYQLVDVLSMQSISKWDGATYLAASNFNCLEFVSSLQDARSGVTNYYADPTQGPYAALACCSAAVYRNYFVQHNGLTGQISSEINLLDRTPIEVVHGYAKISDKGKSDDSKSKSFFEKTKDFFGFKSKKEEKEDDDDEMKKVNWGDPNIWQVGIHKNCEVTLTRGPNNTFRFAPKNRISHHVYAAAFNFKMDVVMNKSTLEIAKELLKAEYRATIFSAWENSIQFKERNGSKKLSLTLLGGGVFRNPLDLICNAILENLDLIIESGLEVYVTCFDDKTFKSIEGLVRPAVERTNGKIYDTNDDESCKELLDDDEK